MSLLILISLSYEINQKYIFLLTSYVIFIYLFKIKTHHQQNQSLKTTVQDDQIKKELQDLQQTLKIPLPIYFLTHMLKITYFKY